MKTLGATIIFLACAFHIAADPITLRGPIDFNSSIEDFYSELSQKGASAINRNQYYVFSGTVTSLVFYDITPGRFRVDVEIMVAQWLNLQDIESQAIILRFTDDKFIDRLPQQVRRGMVGDFIQLNTSGVALVQFIGIENDVAVFNVIEFRSND